MALASFNADTSTTVGSTKQLRVELAAKLPIDPLYMKAMAEYDLSLLLWRSWFTYDKGRRAEHGAIKSWRFDDKSGLYTFVIDDLKWSDGSPLTSDHLIKNLQRISKSPTAYAKSLNATVDMASLKKIDQSSFSFKTVSRKPSGTLFNQFGSVFFSIIHPADLDESGLRLKQNTLALGPYKVHSVSEGETTFVRNPYYRLENPASPEQIVVRPLDPKFALQDFFTDKAWPNYYQTNTLLKPEIAQALLTAKLPHWTRGFDRVALLKPLGTGQDLVRSRSIVQALGYAVAHSPQYTHPLQVSLARSLQPLGYPLFKIVDYPEFKTSLPKAARVLSYNVPQLELIQPWLNSLASKLGLTLSWQILGQQEFLAADWDKTGNDLVLFSFGVADPEPTTWLGLVLGSHFISYDKSDHKRYEDLVSVHQVDKQNQGYQQLLSEIAWKGGYLPLFHGATISIGKPGMSFDLVDPLDETVDYSKIKFSN